MQLEPRAFRPGRDGLIAVGLVTLIVGCVVLAVASGHAAAVLGSVYAAMVLLVWSQAFRSAWAIGADAVSGRRWFLWRTVRAADVSSVDVVPGEPGTDLSIDGRVIIPLDDWRDRPGAVEHLRRFLTTADLAGATVEPAVWRAVERT